MKKNSPPLLVGFGWNCEGVPACTPERGEEARLPLVTAAGLESWPIINNELMKVHEAVDEKNEQETEP